MAGLFPILYTLLALLPQPQLGLRSLSTPPTPVVVAPVTLGSAPVQPTEDRPEAPPASVAAPAPVLLKETPPDDGASASTEAGVAQPEALLDGERPVPFAAAAPVLLPSAAAPPNGLLPPEESDTSFRWGPAIGSTILAIGAQNLCNLTSARFRNELEGPFFADWFKSASGLFDNNWSDGNKFQTNYIAHPIAGAVYAHNARRNDPKYAKLRPGDAGYATGVFRSMAFAAGASLMFEIGPLSEASIGNLGLKDPNKQAWVDPVMTPILGTGWMVLEDVLHEHVLRRVHGAVPYTILHIFLNPARTFSNAFNFRNPCPR